MRNVYIEISRRDVILTGKRELTPFRRQYPIIVPKKRYGVSRGTFAYMVIIVKKQDTLTDYLH